MPVSLQCVSLTGKQLGYFLRASLEGDPIKVPSIQFYLAVASEFYPLKRVTAITAQMPRLLQSVTLGLVSIRKLRENA